MRLILPVIISFAALAGCQTVPVGTHSLLSTGRVALVGKPLKLDRFYSINPDCTSIGAATVRVLEAPQHGSISQRDEADFPFFVPANPRSVCNTKRVPTRQLWYTARTAGMSDRIVVEVIFANGATRNVTFNLSTQ